MAKLGAIFPQKSTLVKFWNRIGETNQHALIMYLGVCIFCYDLVKVSIKKNIHHENKEEWMKTRVRDLKNPVYAYLDEEEPPKPLEAKTPEELFRLQFRKIYASKPENEE